MSDLEPAIALLIKSFSKYAKKDGDSASLSKAEFKELLQNELGSLLGKAPDKAAVDKLFKDLDEDKDNTVNFIEFGNFVCCLATICHKYFSEK